jgi:hypothetical protein
VDIAQRIGRVQRKRFEDDNEPGYIFIPLFEDKNSNISDYYSGDWDYLVDVMLAFSKTNRENFTYYVCMYHDQGLIPLKTLYFEESINVSLNAGIVRTSVDHGTAFDIAYKDGDPSCLSYINAVKEAVKLATGKALLTF